MKFVSQKKLFQSARENKNLIIYYSGTSTFLTKILSHRIPLLFNLYENRLVHSEFLEQVFRDLLEKKEMLGYNFQKKVFSLYVRKLNLKLYNISFFNQSKIFLEIITIFLLVRSFPYQLFINENINFFQLYNQIIFCPLKTFLSMTIILLTKTLKRIKLIVKSLKNKAKLLSFQAKKKLFNNYLHYLELTDNLIKISMNYRILYSTISDKQLTNFYTNLEKLLVILSLKQFIVLNNIIKQFKSIEN